MKQKIVIKIHMNSDKIKAKVMRILAEAYGVTSVAVEGQDKDRMAVWGDGVDSTELIKSLRKKIGYASIVSVQYVVEKDEKEKEREKEKEKEKNLCCALYGACGCSQYYPQCPPYQYGRVYDPYPTSNCCIM